MKRLVIDVDSVVPYFVSGKVSGIGRTTLELVQALSKVQNIPFEIVLYSQSIKGIGGKNLNTPFKCKHLYLRNKESWNRIIGKFPMREWLTGYDLIHYPHNFEYTYRPEKCLLTLHDALFMHIQEKAFNHEAMKRLVPDLAQRCKHIVTCSEFSKNDIVSTMGINPDKVSVIYWGVNHDLFHVRENKEEIRKYLSLKYGLNRPFFLSVSCNAERKRSDKLVLAYLEYAKENELVNDLVMIWGNPPDRILNLVNDSPVKNRIHFLSNISDKELSYCYNCAKVLMLPSSYEGFGLPVIESMACGTPVFTSRNSSLKEIGKDIAFYFDEPLLESVVSVIDNLEHNKFDFGSNISRGLEWSKSFSWTKTAERYIDLYKYLL